PTARSRGQTRRVALENAHLLNRSPYVWRCASTSTSALHIRASTSALKTLRLRDATSRLRAPASRRLSGDLRCPCLVWLSPTSCEVMRVRMIQSYCCIRACPEDGG